MHVVCIQFEGHDNAITMVALLLLNLFSTMQLAYDNRGQGCKNQTSNAG